jgi:hypothetical protein
MAAPLREQGARGGETLRPSLGEEKEMIKWKGK